MKPSSRESGDDESENVELHRAIADLGHRGLGYALTGCTNDVKAFKPQASAYAWPSARYTALCVRPDISTARTQVIHPPFVRTSSEPPQLPQEFSPPGMTILHSVD